MTLTTFEMEFFYPLRQRNSERKTKPNKCKEKRNNKIPEESKVKKKYCRTHQTDGD